MKAEAEFPYPGSTASIREVLELAHAYYSAALSLFEKAQREDPLSFAPARMCAIHAIELYINAFLRHEGVPPERIRARMHNLSDPVSIKSLNLRGKTVRHLEALTNGREYLISRYGPEQIAQHTELNRLLATLVEVMTKVGCRLRPESDQQLPH